MSVFNTNKDQLIEAIDAKIKKIDDHCGNLKNQIYLYSQQRVAELQQRKQEKNRELIALSQVHNKNAKEKTETLKLLNFLKEEQNNLSQDLTQKQTQNERIQRQIIFAEQKNKEERPHLQPYLSELSKTKQSNQNIQYAKDKLKSLEKIYQQQCQEVQNKYRLVAMMKEKLKQMREEAKCDGLQVNHFGSKQSKITFDSLCEDEKGVNNQFFSGFPNNTQENSLEESMESSSPLV